MASRLIVGLKGAVCAECIQLCVGILGSDLSNEVDQNIDADERARFQESVLSELQNLNAKLKEILSR